MRRLAVILSVVVIFAGMLVGPLIPAAPASPVATSEEQYALYGRVFPDPQGCNKGAPGASPYAKGNICAFDFLQYSELEAGLNFLEQIEGFGNFIEVYTLHKDFDCNGQPVAKPKQACKDFRSAGLPVTASAQQGEGFTRDRAPLFLVRVTDESVPSKNKEHFVFGLGMHGIERAGVEGGTRAIEDLVTWGACEASRNLDVCANEKPIPHPLLEATPKKSLTAGEVLKRSAIYFFYPNPDGWLKGDRTTGSQAYQRYNGNGVDLNRDWPEQGFTFRPYTPWSEPETRAFGRVLQAVGPKDAQGNAKWTGGIDLHGQLIDIAFSFTLIGGSERPYDKNQRVLQTVKGAWADAEKRLSWSPVIKPNDAPKDDPRMYGVQWGTVWDTIDYTVTGALGDWIDSPIGLNADGIDNEMSMSHLANCGTGSCWDSDLEQLHVDGNKSLIYAMVNYSLLPEDNTFRTRGKVAYVFNEGAISEPTKRETIPPKYTKLPTQKDIHGSCPADDTCLHPGNDFTYEFKVKGPGQDVYNGGIGVKLTCANAQGMGGCALSEARLERKNPKPKKGEDEWEVVNSYFNQSPIYVQAGQALHANLPLPGLYRVRVVGGERAGFFDSDIDFTSEKAWPDPGQIGYRATNMKFWSDLAPFTEPRIEKVTPDELLKTDGWMRRYDHIVVTDKVYKDLAKPFQRWVADFDGNLVLTDAALGMLPQMGIVSKGGVGVSGYYLGYVNFATADREVTYKDPLARNINQRGAAEGRQGREIHRRQTYEAVPIGYSIQSPGGGDAGNSPIWFVDQSAWAKAKGKPRAVGTSASLSQVTYGEIEYKGGTIRIIGALLPMPTDKFDHTFGVGSYGLTYSGYQLLNNMLQ